jgi:hypothetical protein
MTDKYSFSEQKRFLSVATALIASGTEDYQDWPVSYLNILYAYEIWKDGSDWVYIQDLLSDVEATKFYFIEKLQNLFNYPVQ